MLFYLISHHLLYIGMQNYNYLTYFIETNQMSCILNFSDHWMAKYLIKCNLILLVIYYSTSEPCLFLK
jgi:hypothetical protein